MELLEGYHANLRLWSGEFTEEQIEALFQITPPTQSVRKWAGD